MKKTIAILLLLVLTLALAGCTQVTRIVVENPAAIEVEKEDGGFFITLTDPDMVRRITDIACQMPMQEAEATEDLWTYRITWLDEDGAQITHIELAGGQIRWEGKCYSLGLGIDLSKLTDVLETIPGMGDSTEGTEA